MPSGQATCPLQPAVHLLGPTVVMLLMPVAEEYGRSLDRPAPAA